MASSHELFQLVPSQYLGFIVLEKFKQEKMSVSVVLSVGVSGRPHTGKLEAPSNLDGSQRR
jgi:hypothetical protein